MGTVVRITSRSGMRGANRDIVKLVEKLDELEHKVKELEGKYSKLLRLLAAHSGVDVEE